MKEFKINFDFSKNSINIVKKINSHTPICGANRINIALKKKGE